MNVQKLHHHTPRLRTRSKLATRIELVRNYGLIFLLFGILVFVFTPPDSNQNDAATSEINKANEINNANKNDAPITIVTCEVSTPHSQHPETAAQGSFEIAMFTEDVEKPGSSAGAFIELVEKHQFYDNVYTFRSVKGFVVQFGHHAKQKKNPQPAKARNKNADTVPKNSIKISGKETRTRTERLEQLRQKRNSYGTITMIAGPAGQVFVNTGDNYYLDKDGTVPFGVVLEDERDQDLDEEEPNQHSGMGLVDSIYHDYKPGSGQIPAVNQNTVDKDFPEMGRIDRCYKSSS